MQFDLGFDARVLAIESALGLDGPSILKNEEYYVGGGSVEIENDYAIVGLFDTGDPDNGDGVLTRFVFRAVADGVSAITMHGGLVPYPDLLDASAEVYKVAEEREGKIVVGGGRCEGEPQSTATLAPPTAPPSPTATPVQTLPLATLAPTPAGFPRAGQSPGNGDGSGWLLITGVLLVAAGIYGVGRRRGSRV